MNWSYALEGYIETDCERTIPTRCTRNIISSVNKYQHDSDVKTLKLCLDRSWLFWAVGRRWLVFGYRLFETSYPSHLSKVMQSPVVYYRRSGTIIVPVPAWPLKTGPISCHKESVANYQPTPSIIPEYRGPQVHRGRSLQYRLLPTN